MAKAGKMKNPRPVRGRSPRVKMARTQGVREARLAEYHELREELRMYFGHRLLMKNLIFVLTVGVFSYSIDKDIGRCPIVS